MTQRRTVVVHGRLAADQARLEAARNGRHGVQITSVVGMPAHLAGGFLRGVNGDALSLSIGIVLQKAPPDTVGDLDLGARKTEHPRFATLAGMERAVLDRLPPGMLRPVDLVTAAWARLRHAPAILGDVEVRG